MDDVIDVLRIQQPSVSPRADIAQGKRTLMIIHAMQQPDGSVKERLMAVLGSGEEVSEAALSDGLAVWPSSARWITLDRCRGFSRTSHACLDRLPENPALKAFRELTDFQWLLALSTRIVVQPDGAWLNHSCVPTCLT